MNEFALTIDDLPDRDGPAIPALVPVIDGVPLPRLVEDYERAVGDDPAGGYAGIVPQWHLYADDLVDYYTGLSGFDLAEAGAIWVLGCTCGDVGCWPLVVHVREAAGVIGWTRFRQPHRPERTYDGLGPYRFDAHAYRAAVAVGVAEQIRRMPSPG